MKHTSGFYHVKISNLKKYIQLQNIYINIQNQIKDVQKSPFCFRAKSKICYTKKYKIHSLSLIFPWELRLEKWGK
jgi:hypothetical protein